jgi:uncharacterized protein YndB with AHSA1/START domain
MSPTKITVETHVAAPVQQVWHAWSSPEDIKQWNAASDDWHTTKSAVDLRVGGAFSSRMEAKDGSMGFDFAGTYSKIVEHKLIESTFGDRVLLVEFIPDHDGVTVRDPGQFQEARRIPSPCLIRLCHKSAPAAQFNREGMLLATKLGRE